MKTYLERIFANSPAYNIEHLNLDYDYLQDEIEDKFYTIEGLEDCFALRKLIISHHEISNIEGLEENIHLEYLDLSHNYIRDIENIAHLDKLSYLNLSFNDIRKIENLNTLTQLTHLDLGHNRIKKIENLNALSHLKTLILSGNKTITTLQGLEHHVQLEQLYVKQCKIIDWSELSALTHLQELYASPIQISDMHDALKNTHISVLHLSNRELNRIDKIPHIPTLKKLTITGCAFVQYITGLEENSQVEELDLSNNTLLELNGIKHFTKLTLLDIRNNNLRSVSTNDIPNNIKKIRINGNPLTVESLTELQEWAKTHNITVEI